MLTVVMSYLDLPLNNFLSTKHTVGNTESLETSWMFKDSDPVKLQFF